MSPFSRRLLSFAAYGLLVFAVSLLPAVAAKPATPDKLLLLGMLRDSDFAKLDGTLQAYQRHYEQDHRQHRDVELAFDAFANSDQSLAPLFDHWVAHLPDSNAAHLARGIYYHHLALLARGSGFASETVRERFAAAQAFFKPAKADLEQALALNPSALVAYRYLESLVSYLGERDRALQLIQTGLQYDPQSKMLHLRYLRELQPKWGGSFGDVEGYANALAKRYPDNAALTTLVAYVDFAQADDALAHRQVPGGIVYLDRAIAKDPHSALYLLERSRASFALYNYDEALAFANRALAIEPQNPDILDAISLYQLNQHHFEDTVATAGKVIALDRLNPDALLNRAIAERYLGRGAEAARDMDDANVFGKYNAVIQVERSRDLMPFQSRLDESVDAARQATHLDPNNADAWMMLATGLMMRHDCEAAIAISQYHGVCTAQHDCSGETESIAPTMIPKLMSNCH